MVRDRNKQKQIWSDKEFADILERVKAKRLLNGNPVKNIGQLTKEIMENPNFQKVIQELENKVEKEAGLRIKLDKKFL